MNTPHTNQASSLIRRAARKWGRALHQWGSTPTHPKRTAIFYVIDFGNATTTNSTTNAHVTWHPSSN